MLLRLGKLAIIMIFMTCTNVNAAKRRSRIDLPAVKPSFAPLLDNKKTLTSTITPLIKLDPIKTSHTESKADKEIAEEASEEDIEYDECDVDNVSFELVTG